MTPLKVLIVDHQEAFRESLAKFLHQQEGVELIGQARNGKEALSLIETLQPDIVFSEIDMPGINGVDIILHLKDNGHRTPKFVFVTMSEHKIYRTLATMLGVDGYILKRTVVQELPYLLKKFNKRNGVLGTA